MKRNPTNCAAWSFSLPLSNTDSGARSLFQQINMASRDSWDREEPVDALFTIPAIGRFWRAGREMRQEWKTHSHLT